MTRNADIYAFEREEDERKEKSMPAKKLFPVKLTIETKEDLSSLVYALEVRQREIREILENTTDTNTGATVGKEFVSAKRLLSSARELERQVFEL
jgi:hypothetical protein